MRIPWETVQVIPSHAGRLRCEPGWSLDQAWSDSLRDFDLWVVWAGTGRMQLHTGTILLHPGTCLWMRPGGLYLGEQNPNDRLGVTYIHFDLLDRRGRRLPKSQLPPEAHEVRDLAFFDTVTQHIVESLRPGATTAGVARPLLTGLLMELGARAANPPASGTDRHHQDVLQPIIARIRESPHDTPPVADLARDAGYSPDYFTRIFKQALGQTPEAFIIQAKINRAKILLKESGLSIGQIADALGYCDVFFFSRQFKEQTGLNPQAYRRAN
jgi:AraC-like DNA-binding protein